MKDLRNLEEQSVDKKLLINAEEIFNFTIEEISPNSNLKNPIFECVSYSRSNLGCRFKPYIKGDKQNLRRNKNASSRRGEDRLPLT